MGDYISRLFWVGAGGFVGANARYWLAEWIQARTGAAFPWATFAINISGSFILGLFMAAATRNFTTTAPLELRLAFAVGFLGAYTTFSTFTFETLALYNTGHFARAAGNVILSLLVGLAAAAIGLWLGRLLVR